MQDQSPKRTRGGFTIIELVTLLVVVGLMTAIALPVYLDYRTNHQQQACRTALGGLRSGIAHYYRWSAEAAGNGAARYPTVDQLRTVGVVMQRAVPDNPFDDDGEAHNVVNADGRRRGQVIGRSGGWAYNALSGEIWANTNVCGENQF
ncbi:MAG: hypothetical protein HUU22_10565 [Phycisphaerae bacterium]|nr:hypothetical protein [Phycisphaerae bacterium]NUQ46465.1 hypothetical protein [Phycisphaerae bacterium]